MKSGLRGGAYAARNILARLELRRAQLDERVLLASYSGLSYEQRATQQLPRTMSTAVRRIDSSARSPFAIGTPPLPDSATDLSQILVDLADQHAEVSVRAIVL